MAKSNLEYVIAVEMTQLKDLQQLYDTIRAIQELSTKGAEFDVRVRTESLGKISEQVAKAVSSGATAAPAYGKGVKGGGGGEGGGYSEPGPVSGGGLEKEIRDLTVALRAMAGGGGGGGGSNDRSVVPSDPKVIAATAALEETKKVLAATQRVIKDSGTLSPVAREMITRQMPAGFRRKVKELDAARESVAPDFFAEAESRLFDPNTIVQELAKRVARQSKALGKASVSARATPGGAELTMAIDSKALSLAFETGAKQLGEALRAGITEAMAGLQFQSGGGGAAVPRSAASGPVLPNGRAVLPVTEGQARQYEQVMRPSGPGITLAAREQQRDRMLEERDAGRLQLQKLQERRAELAADLGVTDGGVIPTTSDNANPKQFAAREAAIAEIKRVEKDIIEKRESLAVIDGQLNATIKLVEDQRARGEGGPAFVSAKQRDAAMAGFEREPTGLTAWANRRAGRVLSGYSERDQELFRLATESGVLASPDLAASLTTRRVTQAPEYREVRDRRSKLEKQLADVTEAAQRAEGAERGVFESQAQQLAGQLYSADAELRGAQFAGVNKLVNAGTAQYEAELKRKLSADEISPDQYRGSLGALRSSVQRADLLKESNPGIERELVLFPQEVGAYVKRTLERYVGALRQYEKGVALPQELVQEIQRNDLLSSITGATPKSARKAGENADDIIAFLRDFTGAKTAFEQTRARSEPDRPDFNPDLSVETTPIGPSGGVAEQRVRTEKSLEQRQRELRAWFDSGGTFAPATRDRLDETQRLLGAAQAEFATNPSEAREKRILAMQQEIEFGGAYYKPGAIEKDRGVLDGVLMAQAERRRARRGGVISEVVGPVLNRPDGAASLSPEVRTAAEFEKVLAKVETSLSRVLKTLESLSKVGFDPMIEAFDKMQKTLAPLAVTFEKFQSIATRTGTDAQERAARVKFASDKERVVQEERELAAINRRLTKGGLPGTGGVAAAAQPFVGLDADTALPALPVSVTQQAKLLTEDFKQLQRSAVKQRDLQLLEQSYLATGLPVGNIRTGLAKESAQFDAVLGSFAERSLSVADANPRFFGGNTPQVKSAATAVLGLQNERTELGRDLTQLQELEARRALTESALAGARSKAPTDNKALQGRRADQERALQTELNAVLKETESIYLRLRATGTLSSKDAANVEAVTKKYNALNAELGKQGQLLGEASRSAVEVEKSGGKFIDRLQTKLQSLSAYVFAGGIVFTLASQLRQAATEAVGLEVDLKQIQGVLSSRSSGEAQNIGRGVIGAAADFGVPLRQAVQSSKFFAQTGASSTETVDLTRASLAAQTGADLDAKQATEFLIAVENIMEGRVRPFEILDRIARIEAQYAVSASDLSTAIQRAGSIAAQLQPQALGAVDALDLIIGASTTIIERTRVSGNQAATGLRFMISRLSAPEVARSLQGEFGINLAGDTPNTLRPLQDILQDIAAKFQELNASGDTVRAQQLLVTFAGARQVNLAAALLGGFNDSLKTAQVSALAFGDTQDRVRLRLDSVSARLTQFATAFTAFASSLLVDTGLGAALKGGLKLGAGAFGAVAANPGLPVALGGAALGGVSLVSRALQQRLSRGVAPVLAESGAEEAAGVVEGLRSLRTAAVSAEQEAVPLREAARLARADMLGAARRAKDPPTFKPGQYRRKRQSRGTPEQRQGRLADLQARRAAYRDAAAAAAQADAAAAARTAQATAQSAALRANGMVGVGGPSLLRRGLDSSAAFARGLGATVLGGLASFGAYTAAFGIAVGIFQAGARLFQRASDRERVRTAEPFDREQFQQSPFFKEYEQRALGFGQTPEALLEIVQRGAGEVLASVERDRASGALPRNQVFNETNNRLVEFFDKALPGFVALGDESERIAAAAGLLKESAKLELAVPNTYLSEARTDLADVVAEFQQNTVNLSKQLRSVASAAGQSSDATEYSGTRVFSRDPGQAILESLSSALSFRGQKIGDLSAVQFGASGTISQIAKQAADAGQSPLAALDKVARERLLLSADDLRLFQRLDANVPFVVPDRNQERLRQAIAERGITDPNDPQRRSLTESNYRFANLDRVAQALVDQLAPAINVQGRVQMLANETGALGSEEGSAFAAAIKQALQLAVEKLDDQLQREITAGQDTSSTQRIINTLNDAQGRTSQLAELSTKNQALGGVRDRLFAPIVSFSERSARNRVQSDLQDRFGISFDATRARSDNAQQLLQDLGTLPITLQRDLINAQASFVASKGQFGGGEKQFGARIVDDELAPGRGEAAAIGSLVDEVSGAKAEGDRALNRINLLKEQVRIASTEGLGAFVNTAIKAGGSVGEIGLQLKQSLADLGELGDAEDQATTERLLSTIGGLGELLKAATDAVEKDILPEIQRQERIQEINRRLTRIQGAAQRQTALTGALNQADVAAAQADPRRPQAGVTLQLGQIALVEQQRSALAEATAAEQRRLASEQFEVGDGQLAARMNDIDNQLGEDLLNAQSEALVARFGVLSGANAQLQRRPREESAQLVQELVAPLRTFLSSSRNFSGQGLQQLAEGVAQAAQSRLVDVFLRNVFSETGLLGDKLTSAFASGALSTETAIEAGFRKGVAAWTAATQQEISAAAAQAGSVVGTGSVGGLTGAGGAAAATTAVAWYAKSRGTSSSTGPTGPTPTVLDIPGGVPIALDPALLTATPSTSGGSKQFSFAGSGKLGKFGRAADVALPLAGALIGGAIGGKDSYGQEGASIGALIGGATPLGPVGAFVGGILGGALGGLFGKSKPPETEPQLAALERIERNTREQIQAIEVQTQQLTLGSRFLNVPAGFVVPGFQPFGSGGTGTEGAGDRPIEINVYGAPGQSEAVIADKVATALRDQLGGRGTSFDVRSA
jgi:hypothetical protein